MKTYKIIALCIWSLLVLSCSGSNSDSPEKEPEPEILTPTVFTAIGDVPYNATQKENFINLIAKHNAVAKSDFVIHVGDIKIGIDPCDESVYQEISGLLKTFTTPTFAILGDNEYNDCSNPDEGLAFWNTYFRHINTNWNFKPTVSYQETRSENFSFIQDKVLFVGLNLVGSSIHDQTEWDNRLTDNGNYIKALFSLNKYKINAAVIFGHANMVEVGPIKFEPFTNVFRAEASTLNKPILYLQGDGHKWIQDTPWPEKNIMRVQIIGGAKAVEVTVDPNKDAPFSFNQAFLD